MGLVPSREQDGLPRGTYASKLTYRWYPHIIEHVVDFATPETLRALRATCKGLRRRADWKLGSHIILGDEVMVTPKGDILEPIRMGRRTRVGMWRTPILSDEFRRLNIPRIHLPRTLDLPYLPKQSSNHDSTVRLLLSAYAMRSLRMWAAATTSDSLQYQHYYEPPSVVVAFGWMPAAMEGLPSTGRRWEVNCGITSRDSFKAVCCTDILHAAFDKKSSDGTSGRKLEKLVLNIDISKPWPKPIYNPDVVASSWWAQHLVIVLKQSAEAEEGWERCISDAIAMLKSQTTKRRRTHRCSVLVVDCGGVDLKVLHRFNRFKLTEILTLDEYRHKVGDEQQFRLETDDSYML